MSETVNPVCKTVQIISVKSRIYLLFDENTYIFNWASTSKKLFSCSKIWLITLLPFFRVSVEKHVEYEFSLLLVSLIKKKNRFRLKLIQAFYYTLSVWLCIVSMITKPRSNMFGHSALMILYANAKLLQLDDDNTYIYLCLETFRNPSLHHRKAKRTKTILIILRKKYIFYSKTWNDSYL